MFLILTLGFTGFALSLLLTPVVRDVFKRLGFVDYPDGGRKAHTQPVPRVGGIAIAVAYLGAFAVALALPFSYGAVLRQALPGGLKLGLAASVIFFTGLIDDLYGLNVKQKLFGQFVAASIAFWAGVQVHLFFGGSLGSWWVSYVLTVTWLVGCTNAFNLIDGMDGFAAGVGLFATLTIVIAALTQQNLLLALVTVPLAGCLLGFLRYNFNPASVFLGDCGSLLIGFLLGSYGALWSNKSATLLGMTAPLMAMSIPLLDAGLSILRRFIRHQPIFRADRHHIHHRLLDRGFTPKGAALLMYGASGLAAVFSLTQNVFHNQFGGLIVVLFCAAAWMGVQHLGYSEFSLAGRMLFGGNFRHIIDSQTRLDQFKQSLATATTSKECWNAIRTGSRHLGFHGVRLQLQGVVFEDFAPLPTGAPSWQLRIPLPAGQYVNFHRDLGAGMNPLLMGAFVEVVETGLSAKIPQILATETPVRPMRFPAATARSALG